MGKVCVRSLDRARSGGGERQPHPGARVHCCRCSLPGLTGFTVYRRGGTDAATAITGGQDRLAPMPYGANSVPTSIAAQRRAKFTKPASCKIGSQFSRPVVDRLDAAISGNTGCTGRIRLNVPNRFWTATSRRAPVEPGREVLIFQESPPGIGGADTPGRRGARKLDDIQSWISKGRGS